MKRILVLMLSLCMALSMAACGGVAPEDNADQNQPHTHNYTSAVTTNATCDTAGVMTFTCACGDSYTEQISATGHNWGKWTVETNALLNKPGSEKRICQSCSATETQERTVNAIANSFYDGGLQYIVMDGGSIQANSIFNYASHEFHFAIEKFGPADDVFAAMAESFTMTDSMKAEVLQNAKNLAQQTEGNYGYNENDNTISFPYQAEAGNFFLLGYVHLEGNQYAAYFSYSDFGFEETPETIWKFRLEFNKPEGKRNKYISAEKVTAVPDAMIPCPQDEHSEFIG